MAIIRQKEIEKMGSKERKEKIRELKLELVRANVSANKSRAKTKEIKRAIARLFTPMKTEKQSNSTKPPRKTEKELNK